MNTDQIATRLYNAGVRLAEANGLRVSIPLSGPAYTSDRFEDLCESAVADLGYRFPFTVIRALGEGMEVRTDEHHRGVALRLVNTLEAVVA